MIRARYLSLSIVVAFIVAGAAAEAQDNKARAARRESIEAQLMAAQATLREAEANLERAVALGKRLAISQDELDHARIAAARSRIEFELITILQIQTRMLERLEDLLAKGAVAKEDVDKARQALEKTEKRLR